MRFTTFAPAIFPSASRTYSAPIVQVTNGTFASRSARSSAFFACAGVVSPNAYEPSCPFGSYMAEHIGPISPAGFFSLSLPAMSSPRNGRGATRYTSAPASFAATAADTPRTVPPRTSTSTDSGMSAKSAAPASAAAIVIVFFTIVPVPSNF